LEVDLSITRSINPTTATAMPFSLARKTRFSKVFQKFTFHLQVEFGTCVVEVQSNAGLPLKSVGMEPQVTIESSGRAAWTTVKPSPLRLVR
jgi:hypothetical protein